MEEFKKDLFDAYEKYCIDYMNEKGKATIEECIESFIEGLDHNYYGEGLDELIELFNTSDLLEIEKEIEKLLKEYETAI